MQGCLITKRRIDLMTRARRILILVAGAIPALQAQAGYSSPNSAPNSFRTVPGWAQLPAGRKWGSTAGVAVGPDGNIWSAERCGANSCADSDLDPILEFAPSGKLLRHFGKQLFVQPHGLSVDVAGNVWVTDDMASYYQFR